MSANITLFQGGVRIEALLGSREELEWTTQALSIVVDLVFPKEGKFKVLLTNCGERKINVIKEIRSISGIGFKEANDISERPGAVVASDLNYKDAEKIRRVLFEAGAESEIKKLTP